MVVHVTFIVAAMEQSLEKMLTGIAGVIACIEPTFASPD
ncbi:hypothetical protein GA0115243_104338 [Streptomyces sp. ScaeMP-e83]|nr:hypothetical protein GA0115243_104338 [Streptomyces sp. ScaeMP-e83]